MKFTNISVRVRYAETDQMGYVYYGNYAQYYEIARVEFLRSIGLSYKQIEDDGIMMPVTKLTCNYLAPAYYDDLLNIRVTIPEIPNGYRITFIYEITNEKGKLLNTGNTELVFINMATNKLEKVPEIITKALENFKCE